MAEKRSAYYCHGVEVGMKERIYDCNTCPPSSLKADGQDYDAMRYASF